MAELRLEGIRKRFGGVETLHGVDLHVPEGSFCVFVGPSGCGKSTLLRLIAGLESITEGELHIGGQRVNRLPPAKRGVAMVFQSYALYPHMTVYDNMAFGLKVKQGGPEAVRAKVQEAARLLQIDALLERLPGQLSGGQRQRVAIGRAIVREPRVFLLDEPLSNLDAALRVQMRLELAQLHARLGSTMVHVTHDQVEAMTLADRIVVLNDGNVEQVGAPLDLYHHPRNRFVATFLGAPPMNLADAEVSGLEAGEPRLRLADGSVVHAAVDGRGLAAGARLTLGVRPEDLGHAPSGSGQRVAGRVLVSEHLGESTLVHVDCPAFPDGLVARFDGARAYREGEPVELALPPLACHVFDADGQARERRFRCEEGAHPANR